jgi:hypothetical protein
MASSSLTMDRKPEYPIGEDGILGDYVDDELWLSGTSEGITAPSQTASGANPIGGSGSHHQPYRMPPPRPSGPTTPVSAAYLGLGAWAKGMGKKSVGYLSTIALGRATSSSSSASSHSTNDDHYYFSSASSDNDDDILDIAMTIGSSGSSIAAPSPTLSASNGPYNPNIDEKLRFDQSNRDVITSTFRHRYQHGHCATTGNGTTSASVTGCHHQQQHQSSSHSSSASPRKGMNDLPPELLFKVRFITEVSKFQKPCLRSVEDGLSNFNMPDDV